MSLFRGSQEIRIRTPKIQAGIIDMEQRNLWPPSQSLCQPWLPHQCLRGAAQPGSLAGQFIKTAIVFCAHVFNLLLELSDFSRCPQVLQFLIEFSLLDNVHLLMGSPLSCLLFLVNRVSFLLF